MKESGIAKRKPSFKEPYTAYFAMKRRSADFFSFKDFKERQYLIAQNYNWKPMMKSKRTFKIIRIYNKFPGSF